MGLQPTESIVVAPAGCVEGSIRMPGDKSISHRLAMIGSIAEGTTTIHNFAASADSHSTLACLRRLQVKLDERERTVVMEGRGLAGLGQPTAILDAENSGSTVRMLSGILAGCPLTATFTGDESLKRRPMRRIMEPLRCFGATMEAHDDNFLPLTIRGNSLHSIQYALPLASAQVKSAILLAGLHAAGTTRLTEPSQTRNHTEIALKQFGAKVDMANGAIEVTGGYRLAGQNVAVPGDVSSAAFFVAAALGASKGALRIESVGLNPTRTGFVAILEDMGAQISVDGFRLEGGETVGNLLIRPSKLSGTEIRGHWIANVIDEIPILAVLGTRMRAGIRIRDAAELRVKESDRISVVTENLRAIGVNVEEYPDGLFVPGGQEIRGGRVDSRGDHRIAMAFAVAGLLSVDGVTIDNADCVHVSFPGFFDVLRKVAYP